MADHPRLLVVGSTNVDLILRVDHLPAAGETVTDGEFTQAHGGKGANTAVGAARAGGQVEFLTGLGTDAFGEEARAALAADRVSLAYAVTAPGPTGTALILVDARGQNSIAVAPGANDRVLPEHVRAAEAAFTEAQMVLLQMELPAETVVAALDLAHRHGLPTLVNYAPVRGLAVPVDGRTRTLVVNEGEAAALAGLEVAGPDDALQAAARLRERGPRLVVVTLGAQGVALLGEDGPVVAPAFPVDPVDTTAAGDVFCGAFAVALAEGRPPADAARFACAASAISVTRMGAQPSAPTRDEIERLVG